LTQVRSAPSPKSLRYRIGIQPSPTENAWNFLATNQARAGRGPHADRPLVQPVVELHGGGDRRRGFDWILLDMEHSPNDLENLLTQLQAAAPYPSASVVRVPWNDHGDDQAGARHRRAEHPRSFRVHGRRGARRGFLHPLSPAGVRGVAGTTRAARFGRIKGYASQAGAETCLLVQVETREALDELEAICAIDGVDGVFIGPADLHASFGYLGESANPAVVPAIEDAIRRIRRAGKAPGILTPSRPTPAAISSAAPSSSRWARTSDCSPGARRRSQRNSRGDADHAPGASSAGRLEGRRMTRDRRVV